MSKPTTVLVRLGSLLMLLFFTDSSAALDQAYYVDLANNGDSSAADPGSLDAIAITRVSMARAITIGGEHENYVTGTHAPLRHLTAAHLNELAGSDGDFRHKKQTQIEYEHSLYRWLGTQTGIANYSSLSANYLFDKILSVHPKKIPRCVVSKSTPCLFGVDVT